MKTLLLSFLLFACCAVARAQNHTQNLQLISGIQINKDMPKGFDISAQYQLRMSNYFAEVSGSYFFGTVQYSIIKKTLVAEFEYRYVTSKYENRHRFGLGLIGKYKYKNFAFSNRIVYQREHEYFYSRYENGHEPTNVLRNRFQIKWEFKKRWDTYVSCEPFVKISNEEKELRRVRSIAGMNWEFKKNHTLNLYYQYQADINKNEPEMTHSIGCIYEWDMPKFKKKEK